MEGGLISPRKQRLLIVEDHQLIRRLAVTMLEKANFEVVAAAGGSEAIDLVQDSLAILDCALVDRMMPGVDGAAVVAEIRKLRPDLPVILMSGYGRQEGAPEESNTAFLQKPFTADALVGKVRAILAE